MEPGSIGCAAVELMRSCATGRVTAVFERSAHLELDGVILTLGNLDLPGHPHTIRCPEFPRGLRKGQEFKVEEDAVIIPGCRLELGQMDVFRSRVKVDAMAGLEEMQQALQAVRYTVATTSFRDGFHSFVIASLHHGMMTQAVLPVIQRLTVAIREGDWEAMAEAGVDLAGVGEGLTPSGDDFLAGLVAALRFHHTSGGPGPENRQLEFLASRTRNRTSAFSAQNIASAARGLVSDVVSEWLEHFHLGDSDAVVDSTRRLLDFGHSSGVDTIAGMTTGLATVLERW